LRNQAACRQAVLSLCGPRLFCWDRRIAPVLVWAVEKVLATRHPFAVSVFPDATEGFPEDLAEVSVCVSRRARNRHKGAYGSEDLSPSPYMAGYGGMRTVMPGYAYAVALSGSNGFPDWSTAMR
jgi:hypothetical protein